MSDRLWLGDTSTLELAARGTAELDLSEGGAGEYLAIPTLRAAKRLRIRAWVDNYTSRTLTFYPAALVRELRAEINRLKAAKEAAMHDHNILVDLTAEGTAQLHSDLHALTTEQVHAKWGLSIGAIAALRWRWDIPAVEAEALLAQREEAADES